jgi:hypothetical protein
MVSDQNEIVVLDEGTEEALEALSTCCKTNSPMPLKVA